MAKYFIITIIFNTLKGQFCHVLLSDVVILSFSLKFSVFSPSVYSRILYICPSLAHILKYMRLLPTHFHNLLWPRFLPFFLYCATTWRFSSRMFTSSYIVTAEWAFSPTEILSNLYIVTCGVKCYLCSNNHME